MYKLILHHVYRSSAPFLDLSGHGTHAQGTNVGWSADGAVPQSGAAVFNGSTSRALVPISPVWQDLYALRVDALVRFDPVQGTPGHPVRVRRHLVVEGPLSFSVFIGQERTVTGMVMGLLRDPDADDDPSASDTLTATLSGGGSMDPFDTLVANVPDTLPIPPGYKLGWVPVSSTPEFAPDGQKRTIVPGQWTRITFAHMGTSLLLYLEVYWRAHATTSSPRCCRCRAPAFTSAARPGLTRTRSAAGSMSCASGSTILTITPRSSSAGR